MAEANLMDVVIYLFLAYENFQPRYNHSALTCSSNLSRIMIVQFNVLNAF